ncbi:MAG: acyltransferase family protein [Rhodoglobus sp.]
MTLLKQRTLVEAFDPQANSIGFLRWLMAFMVIFSHAGPLAGFYGGKDLGTQWSTEQSFGGVAVAGFFFFSGFLITKSRMGRSSTLRYFWRRAMRIIPAWWLTLIVTAFILGPIAWQREAGTSAGYFGATSDSPLTYFINNMWLMIDQPNIAGMGGSTVYGASTWNGSAWTLLYEFQAYILVGILGMVGALVNRRVGGIVALVIIGLATLQWTNVVQLGAINPLLGDFRVLLLFAPFALGMLFSLYGEHVIIDDRIAAVAAVIGAWTYATGGWLLIGQYLFCYVLMWVAIRATFLQRWERFGDFSYGIYLSAWPLMQFAAFFELQRFGWVAYHVVIVVACHVWAFISWHAIEKPAMSLKNWTPRSLSRLLTRLERGRDRAKSLMINSRYSFTRMAKLSRDSSGGGR